MRQALGLLAIVAVIAAMTPSTRADDSAAALNEAARSAAATPTGQVLALPTPTEGVAATSASATNVNGPLPSPAAPIHIEGVLPPPPPPPGAGPPVTGIFFPIGSCAAASLPAPPSPAAAVDPDGIDPNFKESLDYLLDVCGAALKTRYARYDTPQIKADTIADLWQGKGLKENDYRKIAVATCSSTYGNTLMHLHFPPGTPNGEWQAAQLLAFCVATASAADPANNDRFFCDGPGEPGNPRHPGGQAAAFLITGAALALLSALAAKGGLKTTTGVLGTASLGAPALCGFASGTGLGTTLTNLSGILGAPAAAP